MRKKLKMAMMIALMLGNVGLANAEGLLTMDEKTMELSKKMVAENHPFVMPAYERLMKLADEAMKFEKITVTDKKVMPASGNKNDYLSFGPYWWPNPETKDGLPYIRKDGKTNPESKTESDSPRLLKLTGAVETLGMAYFYTGDKKYAEKAVELMKVWFLDPETRMNPNLTHGQAIPGNVTGRAIGMIDTRVLTRIIDGIAFIKPSGALSKEDEEGIRKWFKDYNDWFINGEYSYEERNWPNNHGTFYDVQTAGFAIFTGDDKYAKEVVEKAQYKRLASHIGSKGQNFHELERAIPYHYSRFDLEALMTLAHYSNRYDDVDFWNFTANSASLKKAVDYLTPYVTAPETWINPKEKVQYDKMALVLLMASKAYGVDKYQEAIKKTWELNSSNRDFLKWPVEIDITK